MNKPSYNEAAKMFDIVNAYLCKIYPTGWEWDEAVEYIQNIGMMKSLMQIMNYLNKIKIISYGRIKIQTYR